MNNDDLEAIFLEPDKASEIEGYPKDQFGNELYMSPTNLKYSYRIDNDTNEEIYAKFSNGDEYYIRSGNNDMYAKNAHGEFKYAKNKQGDEFYAREGLYRSILPPHNLYARNRLGVNIYPMDDRGNPSYYQSSPSSRQEYKFQNLDQSYVFGINKSGDEVYAVDEMGNEYYPPSMQIAKNRHGQFQYARKQDSEIIYPVNTTTGNEYYISQNGDEARPLRKVSFKRYAKKSNGSYFYPQNANGLEIVINSKYLVDKSTNLSVYPVDEFGNEYMLKSLLANNDYPITYDGRVIVQSQENNLSPIFYNTANTRVGPSNVKEILYKSHNVSTIHFITDVFTTRKREKKKDLISFPFPNIVNPPKQNGFNLLYSILALLVVFVIAIISYTSMLGTCRVRK